VLQIDYSVVTLKMCMLGIGLHNDIMYTIPIKFILENGHPC